MADKFSALWWNEQAGAGGLTKGAIESLTGMTFQTKWNADGSIAFFWYNDVIARAPGFSGAGLLLNSGTGQGSREPVIGDPNWGDWSFFVSPVGYVAPGANAAWTPTLSPTYTPPPTTVTPTATTPTATTPTATTPTATTPTTPTSALSPIGTTDTTVKPSVMGPLGSQPSLPANNAPASIATLTTAKTTVDKVQTSVTATDAAAVTYPAFITKIANTLGVPALLVAVGIAGAGILLVFGGKRSN